MIHLNINDQSCLFGRFNWDHQALPYNPSRAGITFKDIHIIPTADYPYGQKGLALAHFWDQMQACSTYEGILLLDGDVAIDPYDLASMVAQIEATEGQKVITAPIRLWYGDEWFWCHRDITNELSKEPELPIKYFGFGFTYLPGILMHAAIKKGLRLTAYPYVDEFMSTVALQIPIDVEIARDCDPKHLHF